MGIPTVSILTPGFLALGKAVAAAEGAQEMCFVTVPHPLGMRPQAEVEKKADDAFPEILRMATEWQPSGRSSAAKTAGPGEKFGFTGSVKDINKLFFEKGWSLGLPIIPPTPELVEEMLKGTSRKPDEVLGQVPPLMATLTVELLAVHAVMADCEPEQMPVLIAAMEGLLGLVT